MTLKISLASGSEIRIASAVILLVALAAS